MNISLQNRGIQVLDFSSHSSATADPKDVVALQVIETIDASHNKIRSLLQLSIFTSLRVLNLSFNRLESPVLQWLRALPEGLEELDLSHNEISTIESARGERTSIGHCFGTYTPRLRRLNLSHNLLNASASGDGTRGDCAPSTQGSRIEELLLDNNTGLFSLNEILAGLPRLTTLSCVGNHVASLEGIAALAVSCPKLANVHFASCAVAERLQGETFLWNVIGGSVFQYKSPEERRQAQKDMAKLSEYFFAVFVAQVLPSVTKVDSVSVMEARELVGPLISVPLDGPPPPRASHNSSDDIVGAADGASTVRQSANASSLSMAAPTVTATEAPNDSASSSTFSQNSDSDDASHQQRDEVQGDQSPSSPSQLPSASDVARRYGSVMSGQYADPTSRGSSRSRGAPQHVLDRIDYLHKRAVDLQEFIAESQKHTRHFENLRIKLSDGLKQRRQEVTDQRTELAALRMERSSQKEMIRNLQHLVQKKTRELDHAEVANIRVVERKVNTMIKEKEDALRSHAAKKSRDRLRQQSSSGADIPSMSRKPTRSSIRQLEETQRRIRQLKESSPTAASATRFVYNEFGSPELAGDRLDGEKFPPSAHRNSSIAVASASPPATRALHFASASVMDDVPRRSSLASAAAESGGRRDSRHSASPRDHAQTRAPSNSQPRTISDLSGTTRVSLSPENSLARERSRSTPSPTTVIQMKQKGRAVSQSLGEGHMYGLPPRSPKARRSEPDHNDTTLTAVELRSELHRYGDVEEGLSDASVIPTASRRSLATSVDEDTSVLSSFRFPVDRNPNSAVVGDRRLSLSQRRRSSVTPLGAHAGTTQMPQLDDETSNDDVAQRLVDRIVASSERRTTTTGHGTDGQLANPISTLEEMSSSFGSVPSPFASAGNEHRRESRLLTGTTSQQSFHEFSEGSAVSIALQSPKKRISESAADSTRRKPSDIILERAMREAMAATNSNTSRDSLDSPKSDLAESRRVMMTSDGMCAVPRSSHVAGASSRMHRLSTQHRYDVHQSLSLDDSISRTKPDFRRHTAY